MYLQRESLNFSLSLLYGKYYFNLTHFQHPPALFIHLLI